MKPISNTPYLVPERNYDLNGLPTNHRLQTEKTDFKNCMNACRVDIHSLDEHLYGESFQQKVFHSFMGMLKTVNSKSIEVNQSLEKILGGEGVDKWQLLSLQSILLNLNQEVMAVSKIVESMMNAVKTTLHTQV